MRYNLQGLKQVSDPSCDEDGITEELRPKWDQIFKSTCPEELSKDEANLPHICPHSYPEFNAGFTPQCLKCTVDMNDPKKCKKTSVYIPNLPYICVDLTMRSQKGSNTVERYTPLEGRKIGQLDAISIQPTGRQPTDRFGDKSSLHRQVKLYHVGDTPIVAVSYSKKDSQGQSSKQFSLHYEKSHENFRFDKATVVFIY